MKKLFFALFCLAALPVVAYDQSGASQDSQTHAYQTITAEGLKSWLDAGKSVTILDARTREYDDGKRLPGAKFLPYNAKDEEVRQAIPSTESTVVVYCSSPKCPASKFLADRLVEMGYKNVYKYPDGISDWTSKGFPVDRTQK